MKEPRTRAPREKFLLRAALFAYLIILGICVFAPRPDLVNTSAKPIFSTTGNTASVIGHHIIYLDGLIAWIGNFFIFLPLILILKQSSPRLSQVKIFFICLAISITIETTQLFIPGRVSDIRDVAANSVGALLITNITKKRILRNKSNWSITNSNIT